MTGPGKVPYQLLSRANGPFEAISLDGAIPSSSVQVFAPTHGVVRHADDERITIYIAPRDDHRVYAPVAGRVTRINTYEGKIRRPVSPEEYRLGSDSRVFQSYENKTGRVTVHMEEEGTRLPLSFWLEVGEGYITERVRLDVLEGQYVPSPGTPIGEILLGSLSELHLPMGSHGERRVRVLVKPGQKMVGGATPIAILYP